MTIQTYLYLSNIIPGLNLPAPNQPVRSPSPIGKGSVERKAAPFLPDVSGSLPVNPKKPRHNGLGDDNVDSNDDELADHVSLSNLHPSLFVQGKIKELPSRQGVRTIGRQEYKRQDNLVISCKLRLTIRLLYPYS